MCVCHRRPSCENSAVYVFSRETASSPFCPISSKDVSSFYMTDPDLQESPPCPAICSADKVCGELLRVGVGGGVSGCEEGGGGGGGWEVP